MTMLGDNLCRVNGDASEARLQNKGRMSRFSGRTDEMHTSLERE